MLAIDYYTSDELLLISATADPDTPVNATVILEALSRLFDIAEYEYHDEYAINASGVIPKAPGRERDRMWTWIERMEKKLGIEIDVWGQQGEYLTPTTINGHTYSEDDFGEDDDGNKVADTNLAESLRQLVEFHRAWRIFARPKRRRSDTVV